MFETIVALATAPIKSSLAIIRLSGDDCFEIVSKCFSKEIKADKKNDILVGYIKDENKVIDQVVMNIYVAPNSFTGENSVEIMCHGSLIIIKDIITILIKNGAREAKRGEFTERAFLNRKIDLIQAESINDMINASTKEGKDLAIMSLTGRTSKEIKPIIEKVADLLSLIEVNIDYPEYEDIEVANKERIVNDINEFLPKIDDLLESANKGHLFVEGVNVAIVGKPNVGKSSLLNALINENKAIVTNIPGTTRDIVEGNLSLNGVPLHLIDTAGIRESKDIIENIGVTKSKEEIDKADLIILVLDASNITNEDKELIELTKGKKVITVYNKLDKVKEKEKGNIYISALENNIEPLKNAILEKLGITNFDFNKPALTSSREIGLLEKAKKDLMDALDLANNDMNIDLIASSLMSSFKNLKTITGEESTIDISKEIFSRFCVGK